MTDINAARLKAYGIIMVLVVLFLLLTGCQTGGNIPSAPSDGATSWIGQTFGSAKEADPSNPFHWSSAIFAAFGTLCVIVGVIFAVVTRFSTGLGVSTAISGVIIIWLAWLFKIWWIPPLALIIVAGYGIYWIVQKKKNRKSIAKTTTKEKVGEHAKTSR